ncbi:MAG: glucuronate isomerase [Verrucomicrobia bacterium]|nr:glucuronate isomerase [Verrucomicrobiota bacterium]
MAFIDDDFLLQSESARALYNDYAKDEPICDYHCHLPPQDVADNRRFNNLFEIWLEGDHYKWRAMRSNGISEEYCCGDADPYEKHLAWCRTVPNTLRNPLYHWSHLELQRYFGIDLLINEDTADEIWEEANLKLKSDDLSAHGILKKFKVKVVGTTDDPTDSLEHHQSIAASGIETRVVPTFRPDKGLNVDLPEAFNDWTNRLAEVSGKEIDTFEDFLAALKSRHDFFHQIGGRLSDHGLERCFYAETTKEAVSTIFNQTRNGQAASADEKEQFAFYVMCEVGRWNAEKDWTMQFHIGAMRNNNTRKFNEIGPDTGFDSISDHPQNYKMSRFFDSMDQTGQLPKVVIYDLNNADYYAMAAMLGNFMDGSVAGKIQLGSGWWHLDQKEGMIDQMNALSNMGLIAHFVGMLTDSRSFLSYPRHEYFRRILCNLFGNDMENGEIPNDLSLVGPMVRNISYKNAARFFGFEA